MFLNTVCASESGFSDTSLVAYLQQAQTANPELKEAHSRYVAATYRVSQAAALPDPMLQITSFVESVQTRTGPQENVFMISQRLPWFGKLDGRESVASAEAEALLYSFQNKQLLLARKVATAYFDYGFNGKAISLTSENLAWLEKLEPIIEDNVRAGDDINSLLRLKVELGKISDTLQSLKQQRLVQSARLGELLALPPDTTLPYPELILPEISKLEKHSLIEAAMGNNPELKALKSRILKEEARQKLAGLRSYPDFTVGINYIQTGTPEVNPDTPGAGDDPWGITASMNIPLWFSKNEAARAETKAGKQASMHAFSARVNTLTAEISSSVALLEDANRRLALYGEELLSLAEQAAENSRTSYESGRSEILEVIDSERSLLDLQLLSWRAVADAWKQKVIIQTLVNQPVQGFMVTERLDE